MDASGCPDRAAGADAQGTVVFGHVDPDWPLTLTTTRESSDERA